MTSNDAEEWKSWFVPGVFPMTVLEIAADRGHATLDLLARASISAGAGDIFESGLTLGEHIKLIEVVAQTLDDPQLGVEIGWRLPPTALGSLGYALLSSATAGEALALLERFWALVGRGVGIAIETDGDVCRIAYDARLAMPESHRVMSLETVVVSTHRGFLALVPDATGETEAWFDFPEPSHGSFVRERLGRVRYDMPSCEFRVPARYLAQPLAMANPVGLRSAIEWCKREETERGLSGHRLVARLTADLKPGRNGYPTLDEVARRMRMSARTLRRHLRLEGTSYSKLLETVRRRDAQRLLDNPSLAANEVARMLSYEDPANFTRAFRRWTGRTPSEYRATSRRAE